MSFVVSTFSPVPTLKWVTPTVANLVWFFTPLFYSFAEGGRGGRKFRWIKVMLELKSCFTFYRVKLRKKRNYSVK